MANSKSNVSEKNYFDIPVWRRYTLTIEEAAGYYHIALAIRHRHLPPYINSLCRDGAFRTLRFSVLRSFQCIHFTGLLCWNRTNKDSYIQFNCNGIIQHSFELRFDFREIRNAGNGNSRSCTCFQYSRSDLPALLYLLHHEIH